MAFEDTASFQVIVTWAGPPHAYRFDRPFRLNVNQLKVERFSTRVSSSGSGPEERTTKTIDYKLTPVLAGPATIEPLIVHYLQWPDSVSGQLITDPVEILVAKPRPNIAVEEEGLSGGMMALIAVALLGAALGLFIIVRRKQPTEINQTPAETFLADLQTAKDQAGQDIKRFQTELFKGLVKYLESVYELSGSGKPADVIVTELERVETNRAKASSLAGWLMRAEKEKYSPMATAPGDVTRLEAEIRQFFENMK